jgi:endo-beta-N-acetylglucosaminidase D
MLTSSLFLVLASLVTALPAPWAADEAILKREIAAAAHQPYTHGYNSSGIRNWSADKDPYAKYLRSRVPLAPRIAPLAATQAKPALATGPQVLDLSEDYDNSFFTGFKYNDDFTRRVTSFWQYTDIYGSWHGQPVYGSSTTTPNHGLINLPNPAWTDAAHRNGVKSLGCWFWPRTGAFADYVVQNTDGSFPVADKMIEIAGYYGFDGYFINQEATISSTDAAALMKMFQYIRKKAPSLYLQYYDAVLPSGQLSYQNQINSKNIPWVKQGTTPGVDSIFANYWIDQQSQTQTSATIATRLGLNPYAVAYSGTDNEEYGFNPPFDVRLIFPEDQKALTSWGLFGTAFTWKLHPNKDTVAAQPAIALRDRQFWSGPNQDPTKTGRTTYTPWPYEDSDKGRAADDPTKWDGVAHYIAERSVVGGFPFVTRFNTGHGTTFFLGGKKAGAKQWNNMGVQDILPTWQWWTRSQGSGAPLTKDYDYSTAYDGGSSLSVKGTLDSNSATTVRLFKTAATVGDGNIARITYSPGASGAAIQLGLLFTDNTSTFTWLSVGNGSTNGAWTTSTIDLSPYKGKAIATVGLRFSSSSSVQYAANIGEIALLKGTSSSAPATPTGFKVDTKYPSGSGAEVLVSWTIDANVWYYDITRTLSDGTVQSVGRTYDEVYYIKNLVRDNNEAATTLKIEAVGKDGSRSASATAQVQW